MIHSSLSSNVRHARLGISSTSSILKVGGARIASNSLKKRTLARRNHHQQLPTSTFSRCSTSIRSKTLNDALTINENSIRWFSSSERGSNEKGKEKEKEKSGMTLSVTQEHRDNRITVGQVLKERIPSNSKSFGNFLCARSSCGKVLSLSDQIPPSSRDLTFITFDSPDPAGREAFWLSSAYLLAAALRIHFGKTLKLNGGPNLLSQGSGGDGFNYEFLIEKDEGSNILEDSGSHSSKLEVILDLLKSQETTSSPKLSADDLIKLESIMKDLVLQALPIRTESVEQKKAYELFSNNPFKLERIEALIARAQNQENSNSIRVVRIGGEFLDLAPEFGETALVSSTKLLQSQKLTDWSTSTWLPTIPTKASIPTNQSLLLLRGISFPKEALLSKYLRSQEEAAKSDHRILGKNQSLFFINDSSPGTPFFLPNGTKVFRKIERVIRDLYENFDYHEVISPQIFKKSLWERSGHWENYRDDMFSVEGFNEKEKRFRKELEEATSSSSEGRNCCPAHSCGDEVGSEKIEDDESFGLKPMNCPGHCLIFKSQERSYRDLPIRFAEFSPLHRNESSGSLSGLTRVRRFHQDDAHVFCTPSQISSEISSMMTMLTSAYSTFGFKSYEIVLSTRPPKFVGEIEEWNLAEGSLKKTLKDLKVDFQLNEGDGAFYGPKIDIRLFDSRGRKFQTATIQLDFQLPRRFDLKYSLPSSAIGVSESTKNDSESRLSGSHARPVMIHRAILGSVERFFAILIENNGGKFPFWLNPRQAIVLPVGNSPMISQHVQRVKEILSTGQSSSDDEDKISGGSLKKRNSHFFNVEVDNSGETLNKMVKKAQLSRFNFILFVGEKEARNGTVSVRARDGENQEVDLEDEGRVGEGSEKNLAEEANQGFSMKDGVPLFRKDMGQWGVQSLRSLFVKLDDHNL